MAQRGSRGGHYYFRMAALVLPDTKYHSAWLECAAEFDGAHRDGAGGEDWPLEDLRDPGAFRRFVAELQADALPGTTRKPGYVACTYLWIVEDGTVIGSLAIRHELNDYLLNEGGHIGYSVRPSACRRGHAAQALENAASRATIEKNGGVLEDIRHGKRRYWIETA